MAHIVLARKYRSGTLSEIIGQDVAVQALTYAIEANRLPHAFVFTGIRGIGKTSIARILAKALNCVGADNQGGPTPNPCGVCESCKAIQEDRHVDVLEMDAASHTGVDDVRELIDAAQYRPVQGRYKIYIIDEAHMLSRNAFNALLKTLEEPPAHVKFILATTEIHKIPATILSRCLRFDLARISETKLITHFQHIAEQEHIQIELEALALVAKLADGSARDGLSLLEQAFNLGVQPITAHHIRHMVGFADLSQLQKLYHQLLAGELTDGLTTLAQMYGSGADAIGILRNLMELTHGLLLAKGTNGGYLPSGYEPEWCQEIIQKVNVPILNRFWQILLKGIDEATHAPSARMAIEVILVRLVYVQDQPTLDQLIQNAPVAGTPTPPAPARTVYSAAPTQGATAVAISAETVPVTSPEQVTLGSFAQMIEFVAQKREPLLYTHLVHDVHLINYQPGKLEIRLAENAPADFIPKLQGFLQRATQKPWLIVLGQAEGQPTQAQQTAAAKAAEAAQYQQHPAVQSVLETFPGAKVVSITKGNEKIL